MSRPTKIEVNCETGEVQEIELTDEEIAEREQIALEAEKRREAELVEQLARQEAKASAMAKLEALGLSGEEIATLIP